MLILLLCFKSIVGLSCLQDMPGNTEKVDNAGLRRFSAQTGRRVPAAIERDNGSDDRRRIIQNSRITQNSIQRNYGIRMKPRDRIGEHSGFYTETIEK